MIGAAHVGFGWKATVASVMTAVAGCTGTAPAPVPAGELAVLFGGCLSLRTETDGRGVCALGPQRRLRLWVDTRSSPDRPLVCFSDRGQAPLVESQSPEADQEGGGAYEVILPDRARWLALEQRDAAGALWRWRLALTDAAPDPLLVEADRMRRADPDAADRILATREASEPDSDRRAQLGAMRARIALGRGQTDQAAAGLRLSLAAARRAGRMSDAAHDGFALAHVLVMNQLAFADGRRLLRELGDLVGPFPEAGPELAYYEGLLGLHSGDLRTALRAFRRAVRDARRLGLTALAGYAEQQLAVTLAALGRGDEAVALGQEVVKRAEARPVDARELPCNRAERYVDLAWVALSAWRQHDAAGTAGLFDPGPLLARARDALRTAGCADPVWWRTTLLNEALFAITRGDSAAARARLDELNLVPGGRASRPPPFLALWEAETAARLAVLERRFREAERLYLRELALAGAAGFTEGVLRAEAGLGHTMLRRGQRAGAVAHLRAAQAAFEELFRSVPLGEGQAAFLGTHDESARSMIGDLVRLGRPREAFALARLRRAEPLRAMTESVALAALSVDRRQRWDAALAAYRLERTALEQEAEQDWQLSQEALARARKARRNRQDAVRIHLDDANQSLREAPALAGAAPPPLPALRWPGTGEVFIGYAPVDGGWRGFAATRSRVISRALPGLAGALSGSPAELAQALLVPFADVITRARLVRFLPYGALNAVDLHALPFQGRPLALGVAVEYGLDVPQAPPVDRPPPSVPILIVGDPTQDLGGASAEARAIEGLFGAGATRRLEGRQATRILTLELLTRARVFHYAGHALVDGLDAIDSALALANGERLGVGDLLALKAAPVLVTLSACEAAGRGARDQVTVPLGVGPAFLVAGAAAVIAPARPVDDATTGVIMIALYQELVGKLSAGHAFSMAEALRRAVSKMRQTNPQLDWSGFRVLVP